MELPLTRTDADVHFRFRIAAILCVVAIFIMTVIFAAAVVLPAAVMARKDAAGSREQARRAN